MNRNKLSALLLVLALSSSLFGQAVKPVRVDPVETNLRRHVEYLASDKFEGRKTGTEGANGAAGYVANMFAKLKLRPGVTAKNGKRTYLQSYSYTVPTNPHGTPAGEKAPAAKPPTSGYNVIGILDGTDKVLRSEAIVIGSAF